MRCGKGGNISRFVDLPRATRASVGIRGDQKKGVVLSRIFVVQIPAHTMRPLSYLLIALVAGCATIVETLQLDDRYGKPDPARFDHPPVSTANAPDYWKEACLSG